MSRSLKEHRVRQAERTSVSDDDDDVVVVAAAAAVAAAVNDDDDDDDAVATTEAAAAEDNDEEERSCMDAASAVCTLSDSASHIMSSDSSSIYAQASPCNAAFWSTGKLNLMLAGMVCASRERRVRSKAKYPAENSSSRMVSLSDTQVNKMAGKWETMLCDSMMLLLLLLLRDSGIRARAMELNSSCVFSSTWSRILEQWCERRRRRGEQDSWHQYVSHCHLISAA